MRVFAIAGIARPEKFHRTLIEAGAVLAGHADFPDHHCFTARELQRALAAAERLGALPVTTAKDATRLPPELRGVIREADVTLVWEQPGAIAALLARLNPS
jgi:tetraacyldisaccharide 4'-kinase